MVKLEAKKKLVLHICCAPCSTHVIDLLKKDFDLLLYFYNPNIQPEDEYHRRFTEFEQYAYRLDYTPFCGDYDTEKWFKTVKKHEKEPEGGVRCKICYRFRLNKTGDFAKKIGVNYFCTTLTISPHKKTEVINAIGNEVAQEYGVSFLEADFKNKDGFKKSCQMSKALGMYRQTYCGCNFTPQPISSKR